MPSAIELLKTRAKWVAWKYTVRDGRKTKPPVNPHNGKLARNNKPEDWGTYDQAVARCEMDQLAGVGYVLTPDDDLTGADLDHVRDEKTGVVVDWAQAIVDLGETYIEISPSGTGLRLFWLGKVEKVIKNDKMSVEVYGRGRYLTITGNHVAGTPDEIRPAPRTLAALIERASAGRGVNVDPDLQNVPEHIRTAASFGGRGTVEAESELNKWQALNTEALANLDKWVPALFEKAVRTDNGRYRVSSKALGRALQEDLSIAPEGIVDFGIADQGDAREGKRTPIDLVVEYSIACRDIEDPAEKFNAAFRALALRLGHKVDEDDDDDASDSVGRAVSVEITVKEGEISRVVDETQKAIIKTGRPVFVRGGVLVEPLWNEYPTQNGNSTRSTTFHPLAIENFRYITNKYKISYVRWDDKKKKMKEIDPPDKALATLVKLGHWHFPRVSGIINAPTMRPDGSILSEAGYDKMTQLWCAPDEKLLMPDIKSKPSKKDAGEALELLKHLVSGFAFQGPLDRSVALAAILGTVLRGAFDAAPMSLFLAHMAGTGKSYMVDLISTIVRGRPCPVITASRNEDEMEKRIGSLLIESVPIISLDNLSFDLKSDLLCQMCTQQTVKVRVLGKSETPDCEWKGMLFATGNNINLSGDMTRRGLICNLDAGMERPELKEYEFSPIDWVLKDRGAYIAAALTIARAYFVSGTAAKCGRIGSYGPWSKFVREPLVWLGEEDPTKSMEQAYANDPNKEAAEMLIEQWKEHIGIDALVKVNDLIEKAKETRPAAVMGVGMNDWDHVRPEMFDVLVERAGDRGMIDVRKVGLWLRSLKGQVYSGYRIVIGVKDNSNGNRWKLEKMS